MPSAINLIGNKYGELTVIDMLYNYQGKKRTYCKCVNDDGETGIVRQDALQSGATKTAYGSRNKGKYKDLKILFTIKEWCLNKVFPKSIVSSSLDNKRFSNCLKLSQSFLEIIKVSSILFFYYNVYRNPFIKFCIII